MFDLLAEPARQQAAKFSFLPEIERMAAEADPVAAARIQTLQGMVRCGATMLDDLAVFLAGLMPALEDATLSHEELAAKIRKALPEVQAAARVMRREIGAGQ